MVYLYNENEKIITICTNFTPKALPEGYKVISEKEYNELQELEKVSKE